MDDDKLLFFQEYWEERRLKAGPVRCESLCATGNGNPKGYSGILRCVTAKDINPLFFPHSFRQERDFGRGGLGQGLDLEVLRTVAVQVTIWKVIFSKRSSKSLVHILKGREKS